VVPVGSSLVRRGLGSSGCFDSSRYRHNIVTCLTLPDSDYSPPCRFHGLVGGHITALIGRDLRAPSFGVGTLKPLGPMYRTVVPEAAVDEDGDPVSGKHEIRAEVTDPAMKPESEAKGMDGSAQLHLRSRVPSPPTPKMSAGRRGRPRPGSQVHAGRLSGAVHTRRLIGQPRSSQPE
jgi:hypothetical protein